MPTKFDPTVLTRLAKTCAECRRRKQKCLPSPPPSTQCANCAKRWPPVQCVFREPKQPSRPQHPSAQSIFVFSAHDTHSDDASQSRSPSPPLVSDADAHALARAVAGSPRAVGGTLSVIGSCQSSIPVQSTPRNTELLYYFVEYVAPTIVTIDGAGLPAAFTAIMLPWMMQSPLFPHIAVLMSSVTQALERGQQPNKALEPLAFKSRVLAMINKALSAGHDLSDLLRSAVNLVVIEWFWGDDDSMWTHMKGLSNLIRSRGGFGALNDAMFVSVIILMDYSLGNCFETELVVQDRTLAQSLTPPLPSQYDPSLIGPLHAHNFLFSDLIDTLSLTPEGASILTSIHHLTLLIIHSAPENLSTPSTPHPPTTTPTIRATAATIHAHLLLPPSPSQSPSKSPSPTFEEDALLTTTLRLAALFLTAAITTSTPLSLLKTSSSYTIMDRPAADVADTLYVSIRAVPNRRWKRMPGVFLWVMLVAAAQRTTRTRTAGGKEWESPRQQERKFLRRRMAAAAQAVAQEEFELGIVCLRGFWLVERWIAEGGWPGEAEMGWEEEEGGGGSPREMGETVLVRR